MEASLSSISIPLMNLMSMKFRTEVRPDPSASRIRHSDKLLTMGSCFAGNMGKQMSALKWQIMSNPLGISYNPISLFRLLERAISKDHVTSEQWVQREGLWHHFDLHGSFSSVDRNLAVKTANHAIDRVHHLLASCQFLIITFGTAYIYEKANDGAVVTNCHKFPIAHFKKRSLEIAEIVEAGEGLLRRLSKFNPQLKVFLTVSPIRHLSEGLVNNGRSKAALLLSCHQLAENHEKVTYFPSYEIMMDDLRDYRFYKDDLIHPTEMALEYIWDVFSGVHISDSAKMICERIQKIKRRIEHRPFNPETEEHQEFLSITLSSVRDLSRDLTYTNWDKEIDAISSQIVTN